MHIPYFTVLFTDFLIGIWRNYQIYYLSTLTNPSVIMRSLRFFYTGLLSLDKIKWLTLVSVRSVLIRVIFLVGLGQGG